MSLPSLLKFKFMKGQSLVHVAEVIEPRLVTSARQCQDPCSEFPTESGIIGSAFWITLQRDLPVKHRCFKLANHGVYSNPGTQPHAQNKDFGSGSGTDLNGGLVFVWGAASKVLMCKTHKKQMASIDQFLVSKTSTSLVHWTCGGQKLTILNGRRLRRLCDAVSSIFKKIKRVFVSVEFQKNNKDRAWHNGQ